MSHACQCHLELKLENLDHVSTYKSAHTVPHTKIHISQICVPLLVQIHPPTGVTHCGSAFVTHGRPSTPASLTAAAHDLPNLLVITSNVLHIYRVR